MIEPINSVLIHDRELEPQMLKLRQPGPDRVKQLLILLKSLLQMLRLFLTQRKHWFHSFKSWLAMMSF
jgi:hypothetical protein